MPRRQPHDRRLPHRAWAGRAAAAPLVALLLAVPLVFGQAPGGSRLEQGAARAADPGFVAGIEDLPLMPGLTELSGSGFAFGSTDGRIVEGYATGNVSEGQVLEFYKATLPELGWQAASERSYRRQGERLSIDFVKGGGPLTVRFTVTPE
ncbi:MAG: hypothetical protein ACOY3L_06090 [Pseudomonadota bacterium]